MARKLMRVCGGCGLSDKCPFRKFSIGEWEGVVVKCNVRKIFEREGRLPKERGGIPPIVVASLLVYSGTVIVEPKVCSQCGSALSPDVKFCPNCGKATNEVGGPKKKSFWGKVKKATGAGEEHRRFGRR